MRGSIRISTVLLATAALFTAGWSGASAASPYPTTPSPTFQGPSSPAPTSPSPSGACTGAGVQVVSFQAAPATVTTGQVATGILTLRNCTGQALQVGVIWYGRFTDATNNIPPGCPAIDPVGLPLSLGVSAVASASMRFQVLPSCSATGLDLYAHFVLPDGTSSASNTAHVTIGAAAPTCSVQFRTTRWAGGFEDDVTVTNSGTAAIPGWRLTFTFAGDQKVTNSWAASTTQSGATVVATGLPWNANLAAGASAWFGLLGTVHTGSDTPTSATLNGAPCVVR